jgi:small subunit ribosomal protein S8
MSLVDPISDMLTRIRNAYAVGKESVCFEDSKLKTAVLEILAANGYVESFKKEEKNICVVLKYNNGEPAVDVIDRVSKPGRRMYVKKDEIPTVLSGRGIVVISTSKGLMTGDDAKIQKLGGELICKVY